MSVGQFTFLNGKLDAIDGHRVALTGDVQNKRFETAFYHTKQTDVRRLRWLWNSVNVEENVLNYIVRLECDPKIVDPVADWHEAFACAVGGALNGHHN